MQKSKAHPNFLESVETAKAKTVDFVRIELDTAETFADIALGASDEDKKERNRRNARKGFDTALHFLATVAPTPEEQEVITARIASVKSKLEKLGEKFEQE